MHIVQILPELSQGGVERCVVELSRELVRLGHQSTVISAGGKLTEQIEQDGGRHITMDVCSKNPLTFLKRASDLRHAISDISPSVIHVHSRVPAWLLLRANRILRIPVVTTVHGFNHISRYSRVMTRGHRIICVSNQVKDYIQTHYATDENKISVIACGVDAQKFDPERINTERLEHFRSVFDLKGKTVVTAVGRISRSKDYETFIRGIAICAKTHPNMVGLIVGDSHRKNDGYRNKLNALIHQLGIGKQIIFTGNQTLLPEIYSLSDVVISCSRKPETFGLTLIEAMSMNTPVIASRHGGPLDIITERETGRFFSPADAQELAEQIEATLAAPPRELRTETIRRFSSETMAQKTLAVYTSLLSTLHVVQLVPELNQGGVERGVIELNRELVKRGHRSTVISAGGTQADQIEKDGGRNLRLNICSKNPFTMPLRIFRLRKALRRLAQGSGVGSQRSEVKCQESGKSLTTDNQPASEATDNLRSANSGSCHGSLITQNQPHSGMVLHARSRVPAWLCHFANKPLGIPFITTVHGFNSVSKYSEIMTSGDAVICVSNPIKKYIQDNYAIPDEKITVIHRGIDPREFDPENLDQKFIAKFKEKQGLTDKYVVTAVGRITELKDYETFIRAIAACAQTIPNIKGVIVGGVRHDKQAYYERLQALVKEVGAEEQLAFAGSHSHMPEIYALSDVLVSSSKQPESFGRTLIEAMAMNTPVIAPRHGGALDIIEEGQTGLLFTPSNVDELADALRKQKNTPPTNLRKYVLKNFSLDRMTEDELMVYWELIKRQNYKPIK